MDVASPLPGFLVQRYRGWKATTHAENAAWYRRLADEGQRPRAMVISCCDSRVNVASIFGAEPGEFFVHRNIAALVPPYAPDGDLHGTSAAVEYAVAGLHVAHVIVMGHSHCGGVRHCYEMCEGRAAPPAGGGFVDRWMDLLRPGHAGLRAGDAEARVSELERAGVGISLRNLVTFPFVRDAMAAGELRLHGLYTDIAGGELWALGSGDAGFEPV